MMNKGQFSLPLQFLTVEGGEGAGKTSLIELLVETLTTWNFPVIKTREPGGTELGDQIRGWLLSHTSQSPITPTAELLLFLAARAQHIAEIIQPALERGTIVICDRFNDSTVAYQGAGRGLGVDWVRALCNKICGPVIPDLTLYLDVDPKIGLERTRRLSKETACAGEIDRIEAEKHEFHERVRQAFIAASKNEPHRFYRIDANQPQKVVVNEALAILKTRFKF